MSNASVTAVIPAYCAQRTLAGTIGDLLPYVASIVVVDDGSEDGTADVAKQQPRTEVLMQARQGPGAAVHAGLRRARACGSQLAVVVDADGQMDPSKIPQLLAPLLAGTADLVRGNRLSAASGGDAMPPVRWLAARMLTRPASWGASQPMQDPLSGFVALRLSLLPDRLWPGFGYPMHLAAAVSALGGRIAHVPVPARYPADGVSHHGLHRLPSVLSALGATASERLR